MFTKLSRLARPAICPTAFTVAIIVTALIPARADQNHGPSQSAKITRPDSHAPIMVMGDHMHKQGEWMVSIRQMQMKMQGNRIGSNRVSDREVLAIANENPGMASNLRVVPQTMDMRMTMLGMMYAPSDQLTLMLMTSYNERKMSLETYNMMGVSLGQFETQSNGMGDTSLSALIQLPWGMSNGNDSGKWHATVGISLPTGSTKETDTILTPMGTQISARLPYAMQLGSGTYDLKPALTYHAQKGITSFGTQFGGRFALEKNSQGYHYGDMKYVNIWAARQINPSLSISTRLKASTQKKINGSDPFIDKPVQSAHTNFYGGDKVQLTLGLNYLIMRGALKGHRFAFEAGGNVYEALNGPQMSQDWTLTLGYQKAW